MTFTVADCTLSIQKPSVDASWIVSSKIRNYKVSWDATLKPCERINQILAKNPKNLLFIDEKVHRLYGQSIHLDAHKIFKLEALESFKSIETALALYEFLVQNEFSKNETLVVVGGGIIQDIAAFVACTFKRGIKWLHFPTTLLSMSDSCIGGKGGINFQGAKNQLGVFYPAFEVIIQPIFLKTLEKKEIHSGLGEILKSAILGGRILLKEYVAIKDSFHLADQDTARFLLLIQNALSVKKAVIEHDEFEDDIRKVLNYGHTIGHAIESLSGYQIPHGLAVAAGMLVVNQMQCHQGKLSSKICHEVNQLCFELLDDDARHHLKHIDIQQILSVLKEDKKMHELLTFVMLSDIGHTEFIKYPLNDELFNHIKTAYSYLFLN